jgi:hypothetical protein
MMMQGGETSPFMGASSAAMGLGAPAGMNNDPRVGFTPGRETNATLITPMTPLGQFRNTFIIAVDDEGIAIIDQHVAHERILFEQISERLLAGTLESQRLLTIVLDLGPANMRRSATRRRWKVDFSSRTSAARHLRGRGASHPLEQCESAPARPPAI